MRCSALTACLAGLTLSGMPIFGATAQAWAENDFLLPLPEGNGAWVVAIIKTSPPFDTTSVNSKGEMRITWIIPHYYRCERTLIRSERIPLKSAIASLRPDKWDTQYGAVFDEYRGDTYSLELDRRGIDGVTAYYSTWWIDVIEDCTRRKACRDSQQPLPPGFVAIVDAIRATARSYHESCLIQQKPAPK
jgi:hypothetical protein